MWRRLTSISIKYNFLKWVWWSGFTLFLNRTVTNDQAASSLGTECRRPGFCRTAQVLTPSLHWTYPLLLGSGKAQDMGYVLSGLFFPRWKKNCHIAIGLQSRIFQMSPGTLINWLISPFFFFHLLILCSAHRMVQIDVCVLENVRGWGYRSWGNPPPAVIKLVIIITLFIEQRLH